MKHHYPQNHPHNHHITAVWVHEDPIIVYLTIEGETIITTPEHPFYTEEGEWIAAGELQPGDEIRQSNWDTGTVQSIHFVARPQTMCNLTVATAHTFFVGDEQWLVHNICVSKISPDWGTKGAHIHVDGVELAVRPGQNGSIVFTPVFSSTPQSRVNAAIKEAEEALATDASFRQSLYNTVVRAIPYLGQSGNAQWAARSGELHFLKIALEKFGVN